MFSTGLVFYFHSLFHFNDQKIRKGKDHLPFLPFPPPLFNVFRILNFVQSLIDNFCTSLSYCGMFDNAQNVVKHYWLNYWHTFCNKGTISFLSYT